MDQNLVDNPVSIANPTFAPSNFSQGMPLNNPTNNGATQISPINSNISSLRKN